MPKAFEPLSFNSGHSINNRFMLAPLTNTQSQPDGVLSEDEIHWLSLRAKGGFGAVMTAAAHVQEVGLGFPGQLGVFAERHSQGLQTLASKLNAEGALSLVQLHHAGLRSPASIVGQPVAPSEYQEEGINARDLSTEETKQLIQDFISGAERAQRAGFSGVEIHGAHGYIVGQYLSAQYNKRTDQYGGSLENRMRLLIEIVSGIRARCGKSFTLGVRLSPERNGILLMEAIETVKTLFAMGEIDFLDMSLWNVFKEPYEAEHQGKSLLAYFAELDRGKVKLGVAGRIKTLAQIEQCLEVGADFVLLGRAAILHHDYPKKVQENPAFVPVEPPVSQAYLRGEGLSQRFVDYMGESFPGFVEVV